MEQQMDVPRTMHSGWEASPGAGLTAKGVERQANHIYPVHTSALEGDSIEGWLTGLKAQDTHPCDHIHLRGSGCHT